MNYCVGITAYLDAHVSADSEEEAIRKAEESVHWYLMNGTEDIEYDYCEYDKKLNGYVWEESNND